MFGLEKEPQNKFSFDLEKQIKSNPAHAKLLIDQTEQKIHDIKKVLREGTNETDFDKLGILLHGYTSFQKILKKVTK